MKYGIREICDVVFKATADNTKVGSANFDKGDPVLYFDTLKTSSMEGAATTVYAQGGRGNSRLMAWEGERTLTFTMEDALISEMGLAVLTGAGLIKGSEDALTVHTTKRVKVDDTTKTASYTYGGTLAENQPAYVIYLDENDDAVSTELIEADSDNTFTTDAITDDKIKVVMFDFYVTKGSGTQIEITPDQFGGYYYVEASTLFRDQSGADHPAEFIIPNCKVQSNFNFSLASTGDPSTFTFTLDAFPGYTRFDPTKKVLSVIQVLDTEEETTANN